MVRFQGTSGSGAAVMGDTSLLTAARTVSLGPLELHLLGGTRIQVTLLFATRLLFVLGFWLSVGLTAARLLGWQP